MASSISKTSLAQWLHILFGVLLTASFFLPWAAWEGSTVKGSAMATGDFFKASAAVGGPDNPFPKLSFSFYLFWLIPVLAVFSAAFVLLKKQTVPFSYIAGATSMALFTIFYLFSGTLLDLGIGKSVAGMLKPAAYIHVIAAIGLILTAYPAKTILPKIIWLLAGPVIAYSGYKLGEKYIMSETHAATEEVKAEYTIGALELIKEFISNDTATNKKYSDKMMVVNGMASALELLPDSTSTIKFADSTGSYAIFSLEKNQYGKVRTIKQGDTVSLKGVCSGSIFSEILGTTAITFKRATFNSNK
ncbi:MAG: hypothetical protein SGI83_03670 [Bacteroidota bacterium]|nr:hypothetical protein [Bacteroidota bacterium]